MFSTMIQPRVSETDGSGHINNTTVPIWFEAGRQGIFEMFTPDLSFANWKMVVVNVNIDYVQQMYYGKPVEIRTWIKRIGNSSFMIHEELHQNDTVCAKGTATYVNFDFHRQKSEPIPARIRKQQEAHLLNGDGCG